MIRKTLTRAFRRTRRGSIALLAVAAMIPISGMMAASINTSQMIEDRRRAQDAADALAAMHGTWTARSLNILSMNQVSLTQITTAAIGSEALMGTLLEQQAAVLAAVGYITAHEAQNCPPRLPFPANIAEAIVWTAPCEVWHNLVKIPAGIAQVRLLIILFNYDPDHGIGVTHKAMEAIEGMNRAIIERFPRAMGEIGEEYADTLDFDEFHFADPCGSSLAKNCDQGRTHDGMALPVAESGIQGKLAFCQGMQFGTTTRSTTFFTKGFPIGKGPMTHGGSSSQRVVKDFINDDTGVGNMLHDFEDFYSSFLSRLPVYPILAPIDAHPRAANLPDGQDEDGPNSFTRRYDAKFASICGGLTVNNPLPDLLTGLLPVFEGPMPTIWELEDIAPLNPLPPVQADDMPDAFRILAFASKDKATRLGGAVFADRDEPHYGYGQVGVYNPDGADLFSQNWRRVIMPATRMDDPDTVAQGLNTRAPTEFDELADSLDAVSDTGTWGRVHAH